MTSDSILLSLLIWLPIAGGVLVSIAGGANANRSRWLALAVSVLVFAVSIPLLTGYDAGAGTLQFQESHVWIAAIGANYHLGADGISIALILLTTFTTILVVLGAWDAVHDKVNQYMAAFLVLEGLMIGVFAAMDALLFYVFFEGMLIPMFVIIGIWGGPRRVYATLKFFLYTFFGSIFMLIGLIYLYLHAHSWELSQLTALHLSATQQAWL
ncbi:MAG: NADH-quinone oxidoreductase subunit M, partial [Xanthomonadaceae bacterium]|nr:NADH-quinone oxidoreductase subunit M [Xanthomonadaceae bacterium]